MVDVACEICSVASSTSLLWDLHLGSVQHCPLDHLHVVAVEPVDYLSSVVIYSKLNATPVPFFNCT